MAEAIKTFFKYNGRMPSSKEIKNMEGVMREAQGKTADIIQFPKMSVRVFLVEILKEFTEVVVQFSPRGGAGFAE